MKQLTVANVRQIVKEDLRNYDSSSANQLVSLLWINKWVEKLLDNLNSQIIIRVTTNDEVRNF